MPEASGGTCLTSSCLGGEWVGAASVFGMGSTTVVVSGWGGGGTGDCCAQAAEADPSSNAATTLDTAWRGRPIPLINPPEPPPAANALLRLHRLREIAALQRRGKARAALE